MTQEQLAEAAAVSVGVVRKLERGGRTSLSSLLSIANAPWAAEVQGALWATPAPASRCARTRTCSAIPNLRGGQRLVWIMTVSTGEAGDGWLCPMSSYPHDL
ncbi:helix-turn-helix domain-containing protein [Streptomyces sp. NPDC020328]|nr:helix-turn-helix transcriptional regulator [Streptomyces sp. MMBL 11-1]